MGAGLTQSYKEQSQKLAGPIAFLKMYSTRCAQETAQDAVQIFGGRGLTQTGMGRFIEHVRMRDSPPAANIAHWCPMAITILVSSHSGVRRSTRRRYTFSST